VRGHTVGAETGLSQINVFRADRRLSGSSNPKDTILVIRDREDCPVGTTSASSEEDVSLHGDRSEMDRLRPRSRPAGRATHRACVLAPLAVRPVGGRIPADPVAQFIFSGRRLE
jgi:hypothetical protein